MAAGARDEPRAGARARLFQRLQALLTGRSGLYRHPAPPGLQPLDDATAGQKGPPSSPDGQGPLDGRDRARLEGLFREAVARFEADDEEDRQEEFRHLLKSYMRFYSFIAQVMKLEDTSLGKLYAYGAWPACLLPNREVPPEIEITDDMLRLQAFKVEHKEQGSASLSRGDRAALQAITEFGAKPYTEDEQKELSEIVKAFNERHGTNFSEEDMIRFEQVNREIMDDDLAEMLRINPPDVVYTAFAPAFFQGAIRMFQKDIEMRNIVLTDAEARDKAPRHFFNRALREAREAQL